jgi:hypothetical protein
LCVSISIYPPLFLLLIDNISVLMYRFSHILIAHSFPLNSTNHTHFTKFYTSVYGKRYLSLSSMDNLYSVFHGFWCTGLMTAHKWAEASYLRNTNCIVQNGITLDTLIGKDSVRRWESNPHSAVVQPVVQSPL